MSFDKKDNGNIENKENKNINEVVHSQDSNNLNDKISKSEEQDIKPEDKRALVDVIKHYKNRFKTSWKDENSRNIMLMYTMVIIIGIMVIALLITLGMHDASKRLDNVKPVEISVDTNSEDTDNIQDIEDANNVTIVTNNDILKLRAIEDDRTYGTIRTHMFEIINSTTNEVAKLSDGKLDLNEVVAEISIYLNDNKYKTLSIGLVDNKYYIQQDISKEVKGNLHVKIATLHNKFTLDDWLKLTESVYNNTEFHADSLFSYEANGGNKQYIYVYADKAENDNTQRLNQNTNKK